MVPMSNALPVLVTVPEAVALTGKSRRTIMRAIKAMKFRCQKNNDNHWRIARDELLAWAAPTQRPYDTPTILPTLPTSDAIELAAVKAENGQLRERLAAAEADRDRWRAMADKLADRPRRGWWPWGR